MTKILCVNGSLRQNSHTRKLLLLAVDAAKEAGGEVKLLDLAETSLPMYNPDIEDPHPVEEQVRELVLWADAFILGSPDYHGSMSGALKNFLDYFWHEFTGKLFGTIAASHEKGLTVMDQVRTAIRQCYGWSLPYGIGFNGDEDFEKSGALKNERLGARAKMMGHDMVKYGALLHKQFESDLAKHPREPGFAQNFKH